MGNTPIAEAMVKMSKKFAVVIDNGGRRSYIGRRGYSNLFRIPERCRSNKDRRIDDDRRKILTKRRIGGRERRYYFND